MLPSRNWTEDGVSPIPADGEMSLPHLLFLKPSTVSPLVRDVPQGWQSTLRIILPIEFGAPHLDDLREPLQEDAFYPLVELGNPVLEVCVALEVQAIDLSDSSGLEGGGGLEQMHRHTAAWTLLSSSEKASVVYGHVPRSSTARSMSLYKSITLFVLS